MNGKAVSGIMLTLLLISLFAFGVPTMSAGSGVVEGLDENFLGVKRQIELGQRSFLTRRCAQSETFHIIDHTSAYSISLDNSSNHDVMRSKFAPGEIIVKFRFNINEEHIGGPLAFGIKSIGELNRRFGLKGVEEVFSNVYKLTFSEDVDVISIIRQFEEDPNIEYAEPNYIFNTCVVPNDANYTLQWAHQVVQSELAWDTETGNQSVVIAIVDTGVDWTHPDLAANIWIHKDEMIDETDTDENGFIDDVRGWDFVDNDNDPMEFSEDPSFCHGTHCAGIAAAVTNNGIGISGVCWNCKVMAVRVGYMYGVPLDFAVKGIKYAADNGADIISMSWSTGVDPWTLREAVKYAYDKGVLLVASAGNQATADKRYPAAYDEVVAVTATDQSDKLWVSSNFGEWIEVSAPGVQIYSIWLNGSYGYLNGTSMSAPLVAGVAALIWSHFPNMTRDRVRLQLRHTADDLGDPVFDKHYGYGRINARRAVEQAPADHDLLISFWEKPGYAKPGNMTKINATVFNFGTSDERNIEVRLLVNGRVVDSAFISYLKSYMSAIASCAWIPTFEGTYTITSYVVPALGETVTFNNALFAHITVTAVISVPKIFPRIQNAIDAAYPGDTIFISEGTYAEGQINVEKPLTLLANGSVMLDGLQKGHVFYITANNVTIKGFMILNSSTSWSIFSGVYLDKVQNCKIERNTIANTSTGIHVRDSDGNYIYANNITKDASEGLWAWCGIHLWASGRNTLRENNLSGCEFNFFVLGTRLSDFIQDIDSSNMVEGKSIYYLINRENLLIDPSMFPRVGYLALINSTNVTVRDLTLTNNGQGLLIVRLLNSTVKNLTVTDNNLGIHLHDSSCNIIIGNNITKNDWAGIEAHDSKGNKIIGNIISSNGMGVELCGSNNTLSHNNITRNSGFGIDLYRSLLYSVLSNNNTILGNNVINNGDGISLYECEQNYISKNSVCANYDNAIILEGSSNNTISENNVTTNRGGWLWGGISLKSSWFRYSDYNNIIGNNLTNNTYGITLRFSYHNNIRKNMVTNNDKGIIIDSSHGNLLRNNNLTGNRENFGVYTEPSWWTGLITCQHFIHDIDVSNTVNGNPICYLVNQRDLTIDSSDIGYLGLVNCTNIRIRDVTLMNNSQGLLLAFTTNSAIEKATIAHNTVGIHALCSDRNTISASTITKNGFGINLYHSSLNNITKNTLTYNTGFYGGGIVIGRLPLSWGVLTGSIVPSEDNIISSNTISNSGDYEGGIVLSGSGITHTIVAGNTIKNNVAGIYIAYNASNNKISHNNFIDNKKQVHIDTERGTAVNIWDDGYPSGGNYWSDYDGTDLYGGSYQNLTGSDGIGDSPYIIDENNQDNYPLMKPRLRITGDLNNDGTVNIYDVVLIASIYGSREGDPNWNPDADLAPPYGVIDIYDLVTCVSRFGKQA